VSDFLSAGRLRWFIVAFCLSGALMAGLLAWQLAETSPARWCVLAKQGSPEMATSCVTILMKLLEIKDHVVIGLLGIVGLSVLSLAVVALGVRLGVAGPGGLSANIGAETTTVRSGDSSVTVPTPPAEDVK
jgi:hypothetical protein